MRWYRQDVGLQISRKTDLERLLRCCILMNCTEYGTFTLTYSHACHTNEFLAKLLQCSSLGPSERNSNYKSPQTNHVKTKTIHL